MSELHYENETHFSRFKFVHFALILVQNQVSMISGNP